MGGWEKGTEGMRDPRDRGIEAGMGWLSGPTNIVLIITDEELLQASTRSTCVECSDSPSAAAAESEAG